MSLSQKGAIYEGRDAISNIPSSLRELAKHTLRALDDVASQVQAVRAQGNFGQKGPPVAPHPVTAIAVANSGGFAKVTLTHANAPEGTRYIIEYSTTANFLNPQQVDNGVSLTFERYLHGQTLFFRAAPMFPASGLAQFTYFGSQTNPTSTVF